MILHNYSVLSNGVIYRGTINSFVFFVLPKRVKKRGKYRKLQKGFRPGLFIGDCKDTPVFWK